MQLVSDAARPAAEDYDSGPETYCLSRVVRHEHDGERRVRPQSKQLFVKQVAGDRIERCEGLVQKQDVCVLGQGACECYALLHTTRELMRHALLESVEVQPTEELVRQRNATGSVDAAELEGELDVARGGEPGQESGLLKDQRDAPIDCDLTRRRPVKTGEQIQKRRLAATRRSDDADKLPARHVKGHVPERDQLVTAMRESLGHVLH